MRWKNLQQHRTYFAAKKIGAPVTGGPGSIEIPQGSPVVYKRRIGDRLVFGYTRRGVEFEFSIPIKALWEIQEKRV